MRPAKQMIRSANGQAATLSTSKYESTLARITNDR